MNDYAKKCLATEHRSRQLVALKHQQSRAQKKERDTRLTGFKAPLRDGKRRHIQVDPDTSPRQHSLFSPTESSIEEDGTGIFNKTSLSPARSPREGRPSWIAASKEDLRGQRMLTAEADAFPSIDLRPDQFSFQFGHAGRNHQGQTLSLPHLPVQSTDSSSRQNMLKTSRNEQTFAQSLHTRTTDKSGIKAVMSRAFRENMDTKAYIGVNFEKGMANMSRIHQTVDRVGEKFREVIAYQGQMLGRMYNERT